MLIDALRLVGLDALAEVDLGARQNRHQTLRALTRWPARSWSRSSAAPAAPRARRPQPSARAPKPRPRRRSGGCAPRNGRRSATWSSSPPRYKSGMSTDFPEAIPRPARRAVRHPGDDRQGRRAAADRGLVPLRGRQGEDLAERLAAEDEEPARRGRSAASSSSTSPTRSAISTCAGRRRSSPTTTTSSPARSVPSTAAPTCSEHDGPGDQPGRGDDRADERLCRRHERLAFPPDVDRPTQPSSVSAHHVVLGLALVLAALARARGRGGGDGAGRRGRPGGAEAEVPHSTLPGAGAFEGPVRTLAVNGIEIGYRQFGHGPDLIMVTGDTAPMSLWMPYLLHPLARDFTVTIFDNRGVGYTTDDLSRPITVPLMARDTGGLIEALGLVKPTLVGWSMGGEIGLTLAEQQPSMLGALVTTGGDAGSSHTVPPPPGLIRKLAAPNPAPKSSSTCSSRRPPRAAPATARFVGGYESVPQEAGLAAHAEAPGSRRGSVPPLRRHLARPARDHDADAAHQRRPRPRRAAGQRPPHARPDPRLLALDLRRRRPRHALPGRRTLRRPDRRLQSS